MWFLSVIGLRIVRSIIQAVYIMTFFDYTADLVGQLNGNGQKGKLQTHPVSKISGYASLPSGLWLTSPAGLLPRTGISSGTLRSVIEYVLPLPFFTVEDTKS